MLFSPVFVHPLEVHSGNFRGVRVPSRENDKCVDLESVPPTDGKNFKPRSQNKILVPLRSL